MKYKPTIGLEIHAELKTNTKMFCKCTNDPEERSPNVNVCPVCMAHPGSLPVINKAAVKHVLRVGKALGSKLADFTEFDRKNYFYPDIPKGYQISQYKYPLIEGGSLKRVTLTRIHLEEDTARSQHGEKGGSLVDFNRAGLPLMELVTDPEVRDSKHAGEFARELQLLLRYLSASEANMEKGQMRVEANVSVSDTDEWGTKVEVKNINSFKAVEKAIEYEIERQINVIESGEKVVQETRGWDENKQITFSQRKKENSEEYRYFPDPDLPKLKLSEIEDFDEKHLKDSLPELPEEKRERYIKDYAIKDEDVEMFVRNERYASYFEGVMAHLDGDKEIAKLASNYITSDIVGKYGVTFEEGEPDFLDAKQEESVKNFAELMRMVKSGDLSSRGAKDVLTIMLEEGGEPEKIAQDKGLIQKSDEGELLKLVDQIIEENPQAVEEFKAGKETAIKFLMGQGMKLSKGSANPQVLQKLIIEKIS